MAHHYPTSFPSFHFFLCSTFWLLPFFSITFCKSVNIYLHLVSIASGRLFPPVTESAKTMRHSSQKVSVAQHGIYNSCLWIDFLFVIFHLRGHVSKTSLIPWRLETYIFKWNMRSSCGHRTTRTRCSTCAYADAHPQNPHIGFFFLLFEGRKNSNRWRATRAWTKQV